MREATASRVGVLYARFGPTIYARCRRMLKERAAAEDATQEVFLKVLRHIDAAPDEIRDEVVEHDPGGGVVVGPLIATGVGER